MTIFSFSVCCLFPTLFDLFSPLVLMDLMVGLQLFLFPFLLLCICCRKNVQSHPFHRRCYFCPAFFQQVAMYRGIILSIVVSIFVAVVSQQATMSGIPGILYCLILFSIHNNCFLNSLVWPYIFFLVRLCLQATNNSFWCARERWVPHLKPFVACFLNCSTSL